MPKNLPLSTANQHGVVLLESLVAILIFSLGILGVIGLQAAMVRHTADAQYRSEANYIAQQRIGELWADPSNSTPADLDDDVDISSQLPSGKRKLQQIALGQYQVTINWQLPGETSPHTLVVVTNMVGGS